jgi:hypothetical protein
MPSHRMEAPLFHLLELTNNALFIMVGTSIVTFRFEPGNQPQRRFRTMKRGVCARRILEKKASLKWDLKVRYSMRSFSLPAMLVYLSGKGRA